MDVHGVEPCLCQDGHSVRVPTVSDRNDWGKRLTLPQNRSPYLLDSELVLCWSPLMSIHKGHKSLHPLPIWRNLSIYFLPRCLYHQFSICDLSKSLTIQPIHLATTSEQSYIWLFLLSDKMCAACSSTHCEDFPLLASVGFSQKEAMRLQRSTEWYLHNMQDH